MLCSAPSARSARPLAAIVISLMLVGVGCDDGDGTDEAARLGFAYSTDEGRIATSTPLAVGARASIVLANEPGLAFGAITSAASLDPDVVDVVRTEAGLVEILALEPGVTDVEVTAMVGEDGDFVRDTLTVDTLEVERASIALACATADGGPFLEGSRIELPFQMSLGDGTPLTGWGFYPIEVAPAGAIGIDPQGGATTRLPLTTTDYLGQVDLSTTLGGQALTLDVVGEGEIESAFLEGGEQANAIPADGSRDVRIVPIVRDRPLCQGEPERTIEVATPDNCAVQPGAARGTIDPSSLLRIEGRWPGECRIDVRYPRALDGQGLDVTFTLEVLEQP